MGSTSRRFAIPVGKEAVLTFHVNIPREPMQRTYPLHAVIRLSDGRKLYTAATVRVMKRCYLHVAHPILSLSATGQATATLVNNLSVPVRIRVRVAAPVGMVVTPSSFEIHLGPAGSQRQPVMLKTSLGTPAVATTKLMNPRKRQMLRIQTEKNTAFRRHHPALPRPGSRRPAHLAEDLFLDGWPSFSLNYVFINGRPAGSLGDNGSIEIAPYLYYGGKNLIAIARYTPTGIPRVAS